MEPKIPVDVVLLLARSAAVDFPEARNAMTRFVVSLFPHIPDKWVDEQGYEQMSLSRYKHLAASDEYDPLTGRDLRAEAS